MKILVVEDEPKTGDYLKQGLSEAGFVVDLARNGLDGLHLALSEAYDLAILDVMLPGIDGWQILQGVRRAGKEMPVMFLTARGQVDDRVRGLELGADDYLVKPFDLSELFARLRSLIRRTVDRPSPVIAIGKTSIDTRARTVAVEGKPIPLTAKEYMILEYLAQHQGKVISRTELYEHVFDERSDTLSNLLDVHVYNLRKKMACDLIATRRGHGYCIA